MKTKINCILFLALCLSIVGSGFGEIFIGNAEFDDVEIEEGDYIYAILPWLYDYADASGGWPAWISNGWYDFEPEPPSELMFPCDTIVYQALSATYEEGGIYIYSIDVAIRQDADDWEMFLYDATAGDHRTPLISRASTDPEEEPLSAYSQWFNKSLTFTATSSEADHRIGVGFSGGWDTMIDNVVLTPPVGACLPDPYDGKINVLINKTLSWHAGRDPNHPSLTNPAITGHELYMGSISPTDPNIPDLSYVTTIPASGDTAQYIPVVELDREMTYYWRVDELCESDPNMIKITGDLWMFKTVGTFPAIDENTPADAKVDAATDAVFTVIAFNPLTISADDLSFQWYKVGEPNEMLSDDTKYSGTQTASLTVLDVQEADNDEGLYYCVVTNTAGNTESNTSRSAALTIKKMIAHWKFDETEGTVAADSSISGGDNSGTVTNPNWNPDGIVDGALDCDGVSTWMDTGKYAEDLGIDQNKERTVSAWVLTREFNNGGIFDVGTRVQAQNFGLRTLGGVNQWRIQYWWGDMDFTYPSKDTWVHFVHTHGPEGTKVYADGQMIVDWQGKILDTGDDFTFRIGLYGNPDAFFNGLIDDVRLYNYVLEPMEVANLFLQVKPDETVCMSIPDMDISGPDGEPDCAVGLFDFALMASQWMQCNIVGDCI